MKAVAAIILALSVFGCALADGEYRYVASYYYRPGCCPLIVPQGTPTGSIIGSDTGYRGKAAIIVDWGTCTAQPAGGFEWSVSWGDGATSYQHVSTLGPFLATHQYASHAGTYSVHAAFCSTPPYGQSTTADRLIALDKCPGVHPIGVGTTQGDPLAMAMYAIATIPLIEKLQSTNTKQVWYADDATAVGTLLNLKAWWTMLSSSGPSYGYFVNPGKTWLIVQPQHECDAKELFSGTGIGITSEGKHHLGAALGSRRDSISDTKRDLFALPARLGGLAIPNPTVSASFEYSSSVNITAPLISCILLQCMDLPHSTFVDQKQAKATVHSLRQQLHSSELVRLKAILPPAHVRSMDLNSEKGASSWPSVLPICDHGFALHKGAFHDAMCLHYYWQPPNLPSHCVCRSSFNTDHALTCPTGGFPSVRPTI
ncbi:hypothetical protein EMCRGX_G027135 [Ephydatia muelleri]